MRVHEIAEKIGLSKDRTLELLKQNGINVNSHLTNIKEPELTEFFNFLDAQSHLKREGSTQFIGRQYDPETKEYQTVVILLSPQEIEKFSPKRGEKFITNNKSLKDFYMAIVKEGMEERKGNQ